jgi:hypothetical protein
MAYWEGTGFSGPTSVIVSSAFSPAASTKYIAQEIWNGHTLTFNILNMARTVLATVTRVSTLNFSAGPTYNYDIGQMAGAPGVVVVSGSAVIYNYSHMANTAERPFLYIAGDSITGAFAAGQANGYPQLIRNQVGQYNTAISWCQGSIASLAAPRVAKEILRLKPRNIIIYFGTNADSNFNLGIYQILAYAQCMGARVYFLGIPTNSTRNTQVMSLPSIATFIDISSVLTVSGSGSELITALYNNVDSNGNTVNDSIHPGPSGHLAMFNEILSVAPELGSPTS